MNIDSEMLTGPSFDMAVFEHSIHHWEPPYDREQIDDLERTRIKANIEKELASIKILWEP